MKALVDEPQSADAAAAAPAPRAKAQQSALILFNVKAGGVVAADREKLTAIATEHFSRFEIVDLEKLTPAIFKRSTKFDLMVVLGGDGTARSVAEQAPNNAPPLILLPGGTLNVLPRALYGELAWPEALSAALERGKLTRLSMGKANGEPFFVAAIFGAPTLLARVREAVREHEYGKAIRRARHFIKRSFARGIRARPGSGAMRKAEAIGVLCPSYSGKVEGDDLEWVRLDARSMIDLVRLGLRSMGEGWRNDPAIELHRCQRGDVVSLGLIPATLDGEPKTFVSRVRITFQRKGPKVIALEAEEGK
ncbi:MAG: diacylglycerol kinase family protein [Terricaulis sp.]